MEKSLSASGRIGTRMSAVILPPKQRRSARAILLSPTKEVLLISFVVPRSDGEFAFWATPGGEVEEGEDDLAAAQRELLEELELTVELLGPVHLSEAEFEHNGALVLSTDIFFLGRCEREAPRLRPFTQEERAVIRLALVDARRDRDDQREPLSRGAKHHRKAVRGMTAPGD